MVSKILKENAAAAELGRATEPGLPAVPHLLEQVLSDTFRLKLIKAFQAKEGLYEHIDCGRL